MVTGKETLKTIRKEMGITHKDFYAELPKLLESIPYQQEEDTITFQLNGKNIEIALGPERIRELGESVRLPVTPVTISFFDFTEEEQNIFIRCFNINYMKGGG